jgi:hypothetical protein
MPDDSNTVHGPFDGAEFNGKTSGGFTLLQGGGWETCKSRGSTLYPQRLESRKVRVIRGQSMLVEKFRCRCSTGREVRRELAA